jgi:uncharacterized membrane protein
MKRANLLDDVFKISVTLKGVDGLLEIAGGLMLIWLKPHTINSLVEALTQHELWENPNDFFATHLVRASQRLIYGGKHFAAFYLLSHGLVKAGLALALLYHKIWAYPSMIGLMAFFVVIEIYRISRTHSLGLAVLMLFDILIIWLTWREYKKQKVAPEQGPEVGDAKRLADPR